MKKTLLMVLLALSGLTACGEQKITQQVTIDKSLLDALQGKATGSANPTVTASGNPQPTTGSSTTPIRTGTTTGTTSGTSGTSSNVSASADSKALLQVIQANADALNREDLSAYADTLHPESLFFRAMPGLFIELTDAELQYRINSTEVITQTGSEATVRVQRSTSSFQGASNDVVIYSLRQSGSAWKVFFMQLQATAPVFDAGDLGDDDCFQFGCS